MDARTHAAQAANDAAGERKEEAEGTAQEKSTTRKVAEKAGSVVSVVSGYRYYKRATESFVRSVKMPFVQRSYKVARDQAKDLKSKPIYIGDDEIPDHIIRKSWLAHLLVLMTVGPAGILSFYYFVGSLGLWLVHGVAIGQGNPGLIPGLLFSLFAAPRTYVSFKSFQFFSQIKREKGIDGYAVIIARQVARIGARKRLLASILAFVLVSMVGFAGTALAADGPNTGNAAFDQHVVTLSQVGPTKDFGETMINWIAFGSPDGERSDYSLLSRVAYTLSGISLLIMVYLAGLGGLNFVIHTGSKGIPGGQIISSFWMPIRIATATLLLVPYPGGTGYSTLHYGVISFAKSGSAYGSFLAAEILDYIGTNGVYHTTSPGGGTAVVHSLILSEMCQAYVNTTENLSPGDPGYIFTNYNSDKYVVSYDRTPKGFLSFGNANFCGGFKYSGLTELGSFFHKTSKAANSPIQNTPIYGVIMGESNESQKAKEATASDLVLAYVEKTLRPKAAAIAQKLMTDQNALDQLKASDGDQQASFDSARRKADDDSWTVGHEIESLVSEYNIQMQKILSAAVLEAASNQKTNVTGDTVGKWTDEIKDVGWPAFGMIFWHTSQHQKQINELTSRFRPSIELPKSSDGYENDERWAILQGRLSNAQKTAADNQKTFDPDLSSLVTAGDLDGTRVIAKVERWIADWLSSMIVPTSEDANIVTRLQSTGYTMITASEGLIWASIGLSALSDGKRAAAKQAIDGAADTVSGIPIVGKFAGGVLKATAAAATKFATTFAYRFIKEAISYLRILIIPVLFAGFTLGVVLPAIPAMFWLLGVISYLLFFVQCLLVSTFWLAAHGTAEGQGWGSEHTRQGYLLMFGLFINPVLRVAGFGAMLLVLMPVGTLTQWMFNYQFGVSSQHGVATPLMLAGGIIITTVFAYSACVRIFALPSELYEHGLRWINGGQEVTGDHASEGSSRSFIAIATSKMAPVHGSGLHAAPVPTEPSVKNT